MQVPHCSFLILCNLVLWPLFVLGQDSSVSQLMTQSISGQMTYYVQGSSPGECTLGDDTPLYTTNTFWSKVAIQSTYYGSSKTCGACLNVTSKGTGGGKNPIPSGSFLVFVDNECPSCNSGGLDSGFGLDGAWDMSWTLIECPLPSSNQSILNSTKEKR